MAREIIIVVLFCAAPFVASAQTYDASCQPERQKMAELVSESQTKPVISRFLAYIKFLDEAPEEPADCVHEELGDRISDLETKLIKIEISHQGSEPWKVLHCNGIDPQTRRCQGIELDDTPLIPETKIFQPELSIGNETSARIAMDSQYGARILYALGGSASAMQDYQIPFLLPCRGQTVDLMKLKKYRDPVLMVVLEREDSLHLRKVVWFLKNPSPLP